MKAQLELFGREVEAGQWRAELLARLDLEGETKLAARLRTCGLDFRLYCKACGYLHLAKTKCSRKWCPSCGPKRGNERAARLRMIIAAMKWPLHITLTRQNVDWETATRSLLADLHKSFGKLRRSKLWATNVVGGCVAAEITDKGNGLHPHLHAVVDCRWLALKTPEPHHTDSPEGRRAKFRSAATELQSEWARCLGQETPPSLFIRRCDAGAAAEIVKYALKAEDAVNCEGKIGPILRMIDATRMVRTFGSCFGIKVIETKTSPLTCPAGHSEWTTTRPMTAEQIERNPVHVNSSGKRRCREEEARVDAAIELEVLAELCRIV